MAMAMTVVVLMLGEDDDDGYWLLVSLLNISSPAADNPISHLERLIDGLLLLLSGSVPLDQLVVENQKKLLAEGDTACSSVLSWGEEPDAEDIYKVTNVLLLQNQQKRKNTVLFSKICFKSYISCTL